MADAIDLSIVEQALKVGTLRDAHGRATLLAAARALGTEVLHADQAVVELDRLEALIKLDEHIHRRILNEQLEFLRAMLALESDLQFARDIQMLALELARSQQYFIRLRAVWNLSRQTESLLVRTIGLAIHNLHTMMKWGFFLHEDSGTTPWKQLHALFHLAETEGCALVPFILRPAIANHRFTIQSLYLRALIVPALNSGSLGKSHLEIADGWFAAWCRDFRVERTYKPGQHVFAVDLNRESGLIMQLDGLSGDSIRYIRADNLRTQIEEVQTGLRHGQLFAGYGMGAQFPVSEHVTLLAAVERLYNTVTSGHQNRIEARQRLEDREVDVVCGIERVLQCAIPPVAGTLALVPQAGVDYTVESWSLQDISTKGYGFVVNKQTADRIELGDLVAMKNQQRDSWVLAAVVRKLPKRERGILIGLEVLNYFPLPVRLTNNRGTLTMHGNADNRASIEAFYLPGADKKGKQDALLIRAKDFTSSHPLTLQSADARYALRLNRIIRKGADWLIARFEIESKRLAQSA